MKKRIKKKEKLLERKKNATSKETAVFNVLKVLLPGL